MKQNLGMLNSVHNKYAFSKKINRLLLLVMLQNTRHKFESIKKFIETL